MYGLTNIKVLKKTIALNVILGLDPWKNSDNDIWNIISAEPVMFLSNNYVCTEKIYRLNLLLQYALSF